MANIQIRHEGGCGHIEVDGVPLKGVAEANVKLEPRSLPVVEVRLIATESGMDFADGILKVGALHAPEALERALLVHLKAKYESDLLRLPVVSMGMDKASGPDMTVVAYRHNGEIKFATDNGAAPPVVEFTHRNKRPADAKIVQALRRHLVSGPVRHHCTPAEREGVEAFKAAAALGGTPSALSAPTEPTPEDPMEAARALVKRHGGGSGG